MPPEKESGKRSNNNKTLIGIGVVLVGAAVGYGTLLNEVSHKVSDAEYRETVAAMKGDIKAVRDGVERLEKDYRGQREAIETVQRGVLELLKERRER